MIIFFIHLLINEHIFFFFFLNSYVPHCGLLLSFLSLNVYIYATSPWFNLFWIKTWYLYIYLNEKNFFFQIFIYIVSFSLFSTLPRVLLFLSLLKIWTRYFFFSFFSFSFFCFSFVILKHWNLYQYFDEK